MSDPACFLEPVLGAAIPWLYADSPWWTALGLVGNGLFGSRFFIQWLHSERKQQLIVPPVFWHLSFWGSVLSLLYALHVDKLPIVLGCAFLPVVYARNLRLLKRTAPAASSRESA